MVIASEIIPQSAVFLFERGYRIVDCFSFADWEGTGSVILRKGEIEVLLERLRDRNQGLSVFVSFRVVGASDVFGYQSEIIEQLITGNACDWKSTDKTMKFIEANISGIEDRFTPENLAATEKECVRLQRERAKHAFGIESPE